MTVARGLTLLAAAEPKDDPMVLSVNYTFHLGVALPALRGLDPARYSRVIALLEQEIEFFSQQERLVPRSSLPALEMLPTPQEQESSSSDDEDQPIAP